VARHPIGLVEAPGQELFLTGSAAGAEPPKDLHRWATIKYRSYARSWIFFL